MMFRRYIPLKQSKDETLVEEYDTFRQSQWEKDDFRLKFEELLKDSFDIEFRDVAIKGTEYKGCEIFTPKNGLNDHWYIGVDRNFVPLRHAKSPKAHGHEEETRVGPTDLAIRNLKNQTAHSDRFYNDLYTILSSDYVLPEYQFEGSDPRQLFSTSDLLNSPKLLVVGAPGSGKTSLVNKLAFDCARRIESGKDEYTPTPIFIRLRDQASNLRRLDNLVTHRKDEFGKRYIRKRERDGGLIYIFDGFDEIPNSERVLFAEWLQAFQASEDSCQIIVTSRELEEDQVRPFDNFEKIRLLPFSIEKQYEYCLKSNQSSQAADELFGYFKDDPKLRSFVSNPLTLALTVALFSVRGALPSALSDLVDEIISHLTEHWDEKRGIRRYERFSAKSAKAFLSRLAMKLQAAGKTEFAPEFVSDLLPVDQEERSLEKVLHEIRFSTGLLSSDGEGWFFSHRYFQDFFCANLIVERISGSHSEFERYHSDELWLNVWRQLGQMCSDPELFESVATVSSPTAFFQIDRTLFSLLARSGIDKVTLSGLVENLGQHVNSLDTEVVFSDMAGDLLRLEFSIDLEEYREVVLSTFRSIRHLKPTPCFGAVRAAFYKCQDLAIGRVFLKLLTEEREYILDIDGNKAVISFQNSLSK